MKTSSSAPADIFDDPEQNASGVPPRRKPGRPAGSKNSPDPTGVRAIAPAARRELRRLIADPSPEIRLAAVALTLGKPISRRSRSAADAPAGDRRALEQSRATPIDLPTKGGSISPSLACTSEHNFSKSQNLKRAAPDE